MFGVTDCAKAAKGQRAAEAERLRQARTLLNDADRDYDGHRNRAMKELTGAIEDLEGTKAKKIAETTPSTAKHLNGPPPEKQTQAQSDAKMRHALSIMQGVLPIITARHPWATGHLQKAIDQMNKAMEPKPADAKTVDPKSSDPKATDPASSDAKSPDPNSK